MDFRYPDKPSTSTPEAIALLQESEYICQGKYDGWRCQIYKDNGWHILTRMNNSLLTHAKAKCNANILETVKTLDIPEGTVLDGEFVGPRGTHKPAIYIFDCLKWDGQWQTLIPYQDRWQRCTDLMLGNRRLSEIASSCPHTMVKLAITYPNGYVNVFETLKQEWLRSGGGMDFLFEGIVVKWKHGKLILDRHSSKDSKAMQKCKFRDIRDARC